MIKSVYMSDSEKAIARRLLVRVLRASRDLKIRYVRACRSNHNAKAWACLRHKKLMQICV